MAAKRLCPYCLKKVFSPNHDLHCKKRQETEEKVKEIKIKEVQLLINKPTLVKCGKHFIDPVDISTIKEAKKNLWIVKLKSEPNPEWPIWLEENEVSYLLTFFNIIGIDNA